MEALGRVHTFLKQQAAILPTLTTEAQLLVTIYQGLAIMLFACAFYRFWKRFPYIGTVLQALFFVWFLTAICSAFFRTSWGYGIAYRATVTTINSLTKEQREERRSSIGTTRVVDQSWAALLCVFGMKFLVQNFQPVFTFQQRTYPEIYGALSFGDFGNHINNQTKFSKAIRNHINMPCLEFFYYLVTILPPALLSRGFSVHRTGLRSSLRLYRDKTANRAEQKQKVQDALARATDQSKLEEKPIKKSKESDKPSDPKSTGKS